MKTRKSWRAKLADDKDLPKIVKIKAKPNSEWAAGRVLIPAPRQVDGVMKRVPRGRLVTINEIRRKLAKDHDAPATCPITTGIFAWIAAHAAQEDADEGKKRVTPYWRTLKTGGELNPKYPGGIAGLTKQLKSEGHRVIARGKRFFVEDYEKRLAKIG